MTEKALPTLQQEFKELVLTVQRHETHFVPAALRHEQVIAQLDSQQRTIAKVLRGGGSAGGDGGRLVAPT